MIWLSDRLHIRKYGRFITNDVYFALPHGPVPSTTRDILEANPFLNPIELEYSSRYIEVHNKYDFISINAPDLNVFSDSDIEVIKKIFEVYNACDQFRLSEISHVFPEWKKYDSAFSKGIASRFVIDYLDFFENCNDGYDLFIDSDEELSISKSIYLTSCNISAALQ